MTTPSSSSGYVSIKAEYLIRSDTLTPVPSESVEQNDEATETQHKEEDHVDLTKADPSVHSSRTNQYVGAVDTACADGVIESTVEPPSNSNAPKGKRKRVDTRPAPSMRLCLNAAKGEACLTESCSYLHDIKGYLETKPPDLGPTCSNFDLYGFCSSGFMCRFGASHIDVENVINIRRPDSSGGVIDKTQINILKKEVQVMLRKKNYTSNNVPYPSKTTTIDFTDKIYVAPLTTVGNLPFRRVLKDFGADITCGEMALASNLEQGQPSEWALLRRHQSESNFGIQLAGSHSDQMRRLANVLEHETTTDFVDLNCGCPIDIICNKGCGSSLMNKPTRLLDIVSQMTSVLTRPMTIKLRTGWDDKSPNAHKLVPMIQKAAKGKIAAIMIHGRSRLQRYHKAANWEYILEAAQAQDATLPLIPVIGNGDILTVSDWQSHQSLLRSSTDDIERIGLCSCAMLGRGALIKPWLPSELKSGQEKDISASERLDIIKTFTSYGLDHWGSDQQGVNNTRKFLLEWLSFLHRYVPAGIVEHTQGMQQRPPRYFGRNDLETLLSSPRSDDWVKISEMVLGPVPENFSFQPKHKSNSYETNG